MASGDRAGLGELYDRYGSLAMATAVRVVADRTAAEDVVHDAFVSAWQNIEKFDQRGGALRSWLLTIVRTRAIDRVRARRLNIDLRLAEPQSLSCISNKATWESAIARHSSTQLRAAVDSLPAEHRRAVELAYFEGYTYRQIADLTGVPPGTASARLRLALVELRDALRGSDTASAGRIGV